MTMLNLTVHHVRSVELTSFSPHNSNARTIRVAFEHPITGAGELDLTVFGDTLALDALPKAADYTVFPVADLTGVVA